MESTVRAPRAVTITAVGALVAIVIGCLGVGGWIFRTPALTRVSALWVPMKANTAFGLIATGAALTLATRPNATSRQRLGAVGLAAFVTLLGLATFAQYRLHVDLHIDQLLFTEPPGAISTSSPGRMAFISTIDFMLFGCAILVLERTPWLAHALALIALTIALTATLGYIFGVDMLIGGSHTHMAVHTALAFDALAFGVLAAHAERSFLAIFVSSGAGGKMLRGALPAAIVTLIVLARFRMHAQRAGWVGNEVAISLLVVANSAAITLLLWVASRRLDREEVERRAAQTTLLEVERVRSDELRRDVEAATADLAAANRELESFSYSVSHDLRAPLRSIDGFSAALLEDQAARLDEDGKRHLQRIRSAATRMGQLIDDLLELARVTREPLNRETVDVSGLVMTLCAELGAQAGDRTIEVSIQSAVSAHADGRLLRIVLENLLGNAFKFTARTASTRIEFGSTVSDGEQILFVRDNGAGFDSAYAHKLFGVFQRLHRATDFPGTGVGLATVERVVRRHGGRVWGESTPGKGATFSFTLDGGRV